MNKKDKIYLDRRVTVNGLQSHIHLDNFIDLIKWIQERIDDGDIEVKTNSVVDFQYNVSNDECTITLDDGTLFTTLIPSLKSVLDTPTLNLTATGSILSGVVNISTAANNVLTSDSTGLYVPESVSPPITPVDTNSIDITVSGVSDHTLQIDVKVSTDLTNNLEVRPTGLFVDVKANETTTTVSNTVTGNTIGTYTNEDGTAININETITTLNNVQVLGKTIGTYVNENTTSTNIKETVTGVSNLISGNRIGTYTNEDGTAVDINQYITSLSNLQATGKTIGTFTNEASTTFDIKETVTGTTQDGTGAITYTNENGIDSVSNLRSADAGNVLTMGANNGLHYTPTVSNTYNSTTGVLSTTVSGVTSSNTTLGAWLNVGNTGLVADATNLLGTTSLVDVDFITNSTKRGRIYSTGNWYLGNSPSATGTSTVNVGGSINLINTNGTNYSTSENGVIYYTGLGAKQTFLHTGGGSTNATASANQNLFLGLNTGNQLTVHGATDSGNVTIGNNSLTSYTQGTVLNNTIIGNNVNASTGVFNGRRNIIITNNHTRWHNVFATVNANSFVGNVIMLAGSGIGGTGEPSVTGITGSSNVIIGLPYTANTFSNIVSIGQWTRCTANGDVAIGSYTIPTTPTSSFLLGCPLTSFRTITMTPTVKDVIWTSTAFGTDSGLSLTDRAGDDLIIASGRGTGLGLPGTLRLTSPITGSTGTTNHAFPAVPRLTIRPSTSVSTPGNIGINNDTPTSQLHINGSMAVSITTISASPVPALGEHNHVIATGPTFFIGLPLASSCIGRRYIIKCTTSTKTVSSYLDTTGTSSTALALGITTLVSDGTNWQQF